jgi:hypothetical protein
MAEIEELFGLTSIYIGRQSLFQLFFFWAFGNETTRGVSKFLILTTNIMSL